MKIEKIPEGYFLARKDGNGCELWRTFNGAESFACEAIDELIAERDELRAKIEAMEKQEPVKYERRIKRRSDHTWGHWRECYKIDYVKAKATGGYYPKFSDDLFDYEMRPLYALPGAQPQLNEIKIALQRALELGQRETWTGARKHRSREDQREEQQCWNKVWSLLGALGELK